jgi:hypothetical protein
MILYNITISVNAEFSTQWIQYMINDHIPSVLATGHFRDYKLCRVEGEEEGGETFAVQYIAHSLASFNTYQNECAQELQADFMNRWGNKAVAFRTILPVLYEGTAEKVESDK